MTNSEHSTGGGRVAGKANRSKRRDVLKTLGGIGAGVLGLPMTGSNASAATGTDVITIRPLADKSMTSGSRKVLNQETTELVEYLDEYDYLFRGYDVNDLYVDDVDVEPEGSFRSGEQAHIEAVGEHLISKDFSGEIGIDDWDCFIVGHTIGDWGYGGTPRKFETLDGTPFRVNTVYTGSTGVQNFIQHGMVWHEVGHLLGASHGDAVHDIKYDFGQRWATDLTVMGWSYFRNEIGEADTMIAGTGHVPDTWANDRQNHKFWWTSSSDLHLKEYSFHAMDHMSSRFDNWFDG